jgi:hypothetical protein
VKVTFHPARVRILLSMYCVLASEVCAEVPCRRYKTHSKNRFFGCDTENPPFRVS